jgi:hypothetical protein
MTRRQLIASALGTFMAATTAVVLCGCGGEDGNPSRGSISAPRKGGGTIDPTTDAVKGKGKGKAGPGGKLGGN